MSTHSHTQTHTHTHTKVFRHYESLQKKLKKEIDFELKAKTFANKNKKASKQKASSKK